MSVADAFGAAAFGYELVVRLAEAAGAEHRQRWHVTTTAGTVGAAGAAARVLGTNEVDAVAHALSVSCGAAHAMFERTATRFLHRAHAVTSALTCARADKPASRRVLDDVRGTFVLVDPKRLTAERASTALEETGFRIHPATGYAHAAIDAARELGPLEEIARVGVSVWPPAATLASNRAPVGSDEEWWSIEHAVATTLGTSIDLVEVAPTGEGWAATVEATLSDGTTRSASVTEPLGHPERPASNEDLITKWQRLNGDGGTELLERFFAANDGDAFAELVSSVV